MDKKSLYLCLILFVVSMLVGYVSYVFVGFFNDEEIKENDNDTSNDDVLDNENNMGESVEDEEKPASEVYEKIVHYSGDYVDLTSYIVDFDNDEKMKDKLLTLTVDSIKLDGKEYIFSFKNHPQHCAISYDYMREGYNEFYINDKLIYGQYDQACYLERVKHLTIIDNKYIGITYTSQVGNYMKVYDKDIKLVDTLKYEFLYFYNNKIIYQEKDKTDEYIYEIVNGQVVKKLKSDVFVTGDSVELKKNIEKYNLNKLELNFVGEKKEDIDGEECYQYILDITLNGKKIDSGIFGNKDKKIIWSSNYAASFRVIDIDDYYILISYIAKQNDGSYVLIIDKDGNILKSFDDVGIVINKETLELEIIDCKSNHIMTECPSKVYNLKDFK